MGAHVGSSFLKPKVTFENFSLDIYNNPLNLLATILDQFKSSILNLILNMAFDLCSSAIDITMCNNSCLLNIYWRHKLDQIYTDTKNNRISVIHLLRLKITLLAFLFLLKQTLVKCKNFWLMFGPNVRLDSWLTGEEVVAHLKQQSGGSFRTRPILAPGSAAIIYWYLGIGTGR